MNNAWLELSSMWSVVYPVNYGFVPQTVSFDGDPFDALVLGPAIDGGETVRGVVAGLMYMSELSRREQS